ncbi:MAG: GTPase HflX [Verrucomicrobia bacterium]|nr:GTPase HflX [Verrucomicrobiota bacterium]MBU1734678.1 GTPase HflX [Verrucomicrobiota bacterium]MBU1856120.1 GTPase HflX [Verrucomicrobiota bacterium]
MMKTQSAKPQERALLIQVISGHQSREEAADSLAELERLADTAGAVVLGSITQRRDRPDPAFFIGQGKLAEIQLADRETKANLLIFDNELSPVQVNNLDLAVGIKVIDRTELILQIFARRARTAEAQIQVELAQLQYLASRIPVSVKQARFSGGIGMRGPGESPFQLRRAPMMARITILKRKLKEIQKRRALTRERRPWPVACLVGYTNAGKSTLLNALTAAEAYVDDRLFATLDTKSRLVYLPAVAMLPAFQTDLPTVVGLQAGLPDRRQVMLTDTVGFIRHLPHGLVASFRSTLEEIGEADLLLIVADTSHRYVREQIQVVQATLKDMQAEGIASLLLLNKADRPEAAGHLADLQREYPEALVVSALERQGLTMLKERMAALMKHSDPRAYARIGNG